MRAIAIVCVALALAIATGSTQLRPPAKPFAFEVEISSTVPGRVQVYYDTGHSFSEAESVSTHLEAATRRVLLRLPLPEGTYRAIRFDPIDASGTVTFAHARIATDGGTIIRGLPVSVFSPNEQIEAYSVTREVVSFRVPAGRGDPNLTVAFDPPLRLRFGWGERISFAARAAVVWFFVWVVVLTAVAVAWVQRAALAQAARRHPHAAIWTAAGLAAIAATYPVVFCGKSFVSPNINALLRSSPPTLPGYTDLTRTDLHAADDSAVMWQNVPYSVIQYDAIFRHRELPLWNRYLSCGVTLIGQGQSMFGDPLHLFVVAARGASWAWDVKFVAARAVFGAGVGVTVWLLTGDLIAAFIAVLAAVFVAFFNFRFNHPAIFSFAYSVWVLAGWALIVRGATVRRLRGGLLVWTLANVALIGSGTAKEAYVLLAMLNACGLAWWAIAPTPAGIARVGRSTAIAVVLLCGVAITAPLWWPFFDALRHGTNVYTKPTVWQAPRAWVIGLFDDLFYVETNAPHRGFIPAANILVLLGVLFALVPTRRRPAIWIPARAAGESAARDDQAQPATGTGLLAVLNVAALAAILLAHEFVPARWIAATPVLRNIYHIHNTFDAVAVVLLTIIAGCGFHRARRILTGSGQRTWAGASLAGVGILLAAYFYDLRQIWMAGPGFGGWIAGIGAHLFFYANLAAMFVASAVLVHLARRRLRGERIGAVWAVIGAVGAATLLYRHGLHLEAVMGSDYLSVPMARADLAAPSPTIEQIQSDRGDGPFRVVGTDLTLINGWNAMYGLESLNGPDAIMNADYRDVLVTAGLIPRDDWRLQLSPSAVDRAAPLLDLLGVRYVVSEQSLATTHYGASGTADLHAYRSERAWPRAFFTDRLTTYTRTQDFIGLAESAREPFAAVQLDDVDTLPPELKRLAHDTRGDRGGLRAARDFTLTANTTTFHIDAPRAGVAVLHETWLNADFRATLDGKPVPYFRVNHAFKGVFVPEAGRHVVAFSYWPEHLTLALWAAAAGVAGLVLTVWGVGRVAGRG